MNLNSTIGGLPPIAWGGMFLFIFLSVQVLGGMKFIKIPLLWHKRIGIAILIIALLHGVLGLIYFLS